MATIDMPKGKQKMYQPLEVKARILSLADDLIQTAQAAGVRPCEVAAALQIALALYGPITPIKVLGLSPEDEKSQVELLESLR